MRTNMMDLLRSIQEMLLKTTDPRFVDAHVSLETGRLVVHLAPGEEFAIYVRDRTQHKTLGRPNG